jgi:orotate phosphoribosyltransferase
MKKIAEILVNTKAVKTNFADPFTWTSGIRSPIYCDCRELIGNPEARTAITDAFVQIISSMKLKTDVIAGTATAGIPWAAFVAQELNKPMLYVRSKPKGHGAGKMVEGKVDPHQHILVIEDAFSTAGSSIVSAQALRTELNATVTDLCGIFSWETQKATENAKQGLVTLHPLTGFQEITETLRETKTINHTEYQELKRFHQNPSEWWNSYPQNS